MYGLFLVYGKEHFPSQSHGHFRLLPGPGKTLARQGFPLPLRRDFGDGVTAPQSAEFCTCFEGVGLGGFRHASKLEGKPRSGRNR